METQILVRKYDGSQEPFSSKKLLHVLGKAGADVSTAQRINNAIAERLHDGITTKEIYASAFDLLQNTHPSKAARFHLKRAIMELGPSGFPFESFVAALFAHQGFKVQVGVTVQGKCVTHEVDVIAEKDDHHYMVECKYHNALGNVSDVKIALYVHARFHDVEWQWKKQPEHAVKFHQGWLVTNTRLTSDALRYGMCAGLKMLSWDYPHGHGLKDLVDQTGLYPITCLTTLSRLEKEELLKRRMVMCHDVCTNPSVLGEIGISNERIPDILHEGGILCSTLLNKTPTKS